MSWGLVVAGVGSLAGAYFSSQGAKKAGDKAAAGYDAATQETARQYDQTRSDYAPYRAVGNQAINALGSIYGYAPSESYFPQQQQGTPYQQQFSPNKLGDTGAGKAYENFVQPMINPAGHIASRLGVSPNSGLGKVLDPLGGLFGSSHGDEKRNLKAFLGQNQITDLGNGMLAMPDGSQFQSSQLKDIAGAWYGATYAPDGDQTGWQSKYSTILGGLTKPAAPAAPAGQAQAGGPPGAANAPDYSAFYKSPDFNFRRTEGTRDIGNSFAARGGAASGNALKALDEFNQNLAAGGFNDYFNHQASLAGIGQSATNATAGFGAQAANQNANALIGGADARASGVADKYNAWGAGLSGLAQAGGYYLGNRGGQNQLNYFTPTARRVG